MDNERDVAQLLLVAGTAAQIILENGAETYRVEDTVLRICRSYGYKQADVLAFSTGVSISVTENARSQAIIRRIRQRTLRLDKVNQVNDLSRRIAEGSIPLEDALDKLHTINNTATDNYWFQGLFAALSSGFFTIMFGGGLPEFFIGGICGGLAQLAGTVVNRKVASSYMILPGLLGGLICSLVAMGAFFAFHLSTQSVEAIISGAIMPLVTGLLMTNAVRDLMRGDLVSSLARGAEALLATIMVALGVMLLLRIYLPTEVSTDPAMPNWLVATIAAGLGSLFYTRLIYTPKASIWLSAFIALVSYGLYALLKSVLLWNDTLCLFLYAFTAALFCEIAAKYTKMIATVYLSAALVPLVPGITLYRTIRELIFGNSAEASRLGLSAAIIVGTLALGVALGSMVISMCKHIAAATEKRNSLK
ncbi:MAG: threonine/serine ThrE exporter family protein [Christensenellales bacterium]|jgi:uncharacterized membrane protein YjjP (DUF1212 family)